MMRPGAVREGVAGWTPRSILTVCTMGEREGAGIAVKVFSCEPLLFTRPGAVREGESAMWYVWVRANGEWSIRSEQYSEFAALLVSEACLRGGWCQEAMVEHVK